MHLFRTPWLSSDIIPRTTPSSRRNFARQARKVALLEHLDALPGAPLQLQTWILQRLELHDAEACNARAA